LVKEKTSEEIPQIIQVSDSFHFVFCCRFAETAQPEKGKFRRCWHAAAADDWVVGSVNGQRG